MPFLGTPSLVREHPIPRLRRTDRIQQALIPEPSLKNARDGSTSPFEDPGPGPGPGPRSSRARGTPDQKESRQLKLSPGMVPLQHKTSPFCRAPRRSASHETHGAALLVKPAIVPTILRCGYFRAVNYSLASLPNPGVKWSVPRRKTTGRDYRD